MNGIPEYLLKLSVAISIVYLFYYVVLRRLTFYEWNRFYLLGYGLISFLLSTIDISFLLNASKNTPIMVRKIPIVSMPQNVENDGWLSWYNILIFVFLLGTMIMLVRFLIRMYSLYLLRKKSTLIADNGIKVYEADEETSPFSYGKYIFVNRSLFDDEAIKEIIAHEMVHIKQLHFIDIIFAEVLCIILWFNPFAWLMRRAIKQNLEFIADDKVLQHGIEKKQYQYLLLRVMGNNHYSISTHFNLQSLKNRINMMNRIKTARVQLLRFLFLVPLAAILLLAFRKEAMPKRQIMSDTIVDTVPKYNVKVISPNGIPIAIATDKNGKEVSRLILEDPDIKNAKGKEAFLNKLKTWERNYGAVPPPPPPPPVPFDPGIAPPPPPTPKKSTKMPAPTIVKPDGKKVIPQPKQRVPPPPPPTLKKSTNMPAPTIVKPDGKKVIPQPKQKVPPPPPQPSPVKPISINLANEVQSVSIKTNKSNSNQNGNRIESENSSTIIIQLKDGKRVEEDISTSEKRNSVSKKYGIDFGNHSSNKSSK